MTRLSAECLDASWGSAADARRLADAMAENDAMADRAAAIDTDAIEARAAGDCFCCLAAAFVAVGVGVWLTWMGGGF